MTNSIYISTAEAHSGKALVALGMMELLLRKSAKVGFFRPVISDSYNKEPDQDITLILDHFNLNMTYDEAYGFHRKEMNSLIGSGKYDYVLDTIIEKFKALEEKCDFVLIGGSDYLGEGAAFEFNINADIAKNLGAPILILGNAHHKSVEEAITPVQLSIDSFTEKDCEVAGVIINKVAPVLLEATHRKLQETFGDDIRMLSAIPTDKKIGNPSIKDIATHLKANVLHGEEKMSNQVESYSIAAMQMQNFITRLRENALVITPGDRADIILACLQAHKSKTYPNIAGILLSTGLTPSAEIERLLEGLSDIVPILSIEKNTYNTASALNEVISSMRPDDQERIAHAKQVFDKYVDTKTLEEQIQAIEVKGITPKMFQFNLVKRAKKAKKRIVLPEGSDHRILRAASILVDQDIVNITLLGKEDELRRVAVERAIDMDWGKVEVIDPIESDKFEDYSNTFYELRKNKGVSPAMAADTMGDVSYFGTMMVYKGDADGMVSGAVNTTAHTIRPALQFVKTKPDVSVVSSVFFMSLPEKVLVYGDCAVNPNPNPEQLAEIAISSAETAISFGIEPKIAMLSYSSGSSGSGEEVEKVRAATKIAKERRPDLKIEGPIQYDAAVDPTVGEQKMPGSEVAGQANVLIFPDLNTGNNTYKAVQRETGAIAIGPVLQGLNKPVNDLSRGCLVEDIINTVVITAIQA